MRKKDKSVEKLSKKVKDGSKKPTHSNDEEVKIGLPDIDLKRVMGCGG